MKLYTKTINNIPHILPADKIVLIKDDMQIFNPTKEMLLEDEWKIYEPEIHEPSEEEILRMHKEHLKDDILRYDSSDEVNIFYVGEMPIWLDKSTRAGLMLRFNAEAAIQKTETSLWYNNFEFKLPLTNAIQMLYAIEVYASACYDNTQKHLAEIEKITNLEDLKQYDYTIGYPDKLVF